jgi:hypothetical protein
VSAALEFREADHSYWVGGAQWPSVTNVLRPLQELEGIPKAVLDAAAEFGRHTHLAIHLFNLGRLDEQDLDEPLRPYLEGWKQFLFDTKAVVVSSERRVHHRILKVAGTLDNEIRFPPKDPRHVLDLKSGSVVHWTVALQTAAYREMLAHEEAMADGGLNANGPLSKVRFCCHLLGDGKYRLITLKDQAGDWNSFVSALNFHRMRERHARLV